MAKPSNEKRTNQKLVGRFWRGIYEDYLLPRMSEARYLYLLATDGEASYAMIETGAIWHDLDDENRIGHS